MIVTSLGWPAPPNIRAFYTTRDGGVSALGFGSFNLATHVGDTPSAVQENRRRLMVLLAQYSSQPELDIQWLNQVHSVDVHSCTRPCAKPAMADAAITKNKQLVCAVLTADCLPLIFCDIEGRQVAAVHAGWRGLAAGIVANTVANFDAPPEALLCYMGPAISQRHFQVGEEVKAAFADAQRQRTFSGETAAAFCADETTQDSPKYHADLYQLARLELQGLGVTQIYGGEHCSFGDATQFYSYRRENNTGRMATGIWIE